MTLPAASPIVRLVLAYDGSGFHGWQVQPRGVRTVQGEITARLNRLIGFDGIPAGAGRTDAGVHARGQVSTFPVADEAAVKRVARALPRMLPEDIALREVSSEPPGFHARFSARGRRYSYRILRQPDPLRRHDHLIHPGDLDVERMREALPGLLGRHDCTSFCRKASVDPDRMECEIHQAGLESTGPTLVFTIAADRFVHSMVRTVVGTLLEIGQHRRPADAFPRILAARDRAAGGQTAPAQGLSLDHVEYDGERGPNLLAPGQSLACDV